MNEINLNEKVLKYLFVVKFEDGTIYEQDEHDKATIADRGSSFTDVLELSKKSPVEQVALTDGEIVYMLDMKTGDFSVNGVGPFRFHDKDVPYFNKRIVLFRRRYVDPMTGIEDANLIQYALGWQANLEDNENSPNKSFIMYID